MDTIIKSILDNDSNIPYTILVRAEFHDDVTFTTWNDNVFRVNQSGQSVYWDELGTGEKEYLGAGNLLNIASIEEGIDLQNYTLNVSLSGIPFDNNFMAEVQDASYKNGSLIVYLALLDDQYTVQYDTDPEDGPIVLFAGRMDTMSVSLGSTASINVQASSRLADWERTRGGRYNRQTQGRYYDLSLLGSGEAFAQTTRDKGFDYVETIRQKEILWGGLAFLGGGNDGPINNTRGGGSPGNNFGQNLNNFHNQNPQIEPFNPEGMGF